MKSHRLLPMLFGLFVLTSCGGGGGSNATNTPNPGPLPPDPGVDGLATVEGIDTNTNGVRDDVERAIYERHPTAAANVMSALMQNARAFQSNVMAGDAGSPSAVDQSLSLGLASLQCLYSTMQNPEEEVAFIEDMTLNTDERVTAYLAFDEMLAGQSFTVGEIQNPCNDQ